MSRAVCGAVGPLGRAVLAQSSSHLVITRSGARILDLAFSKPSNPVSSLLLKSASDFHDTFGDGVKTYLIFLNALFKQVALTSRSAGSYCLLSRLAMFCVHLEDCFAHKNCTCVLTEDTLRSVIETFFSTRFAPAVSEVLSRLVFEWVSNLSSVLDASTYVSNFSLLCVKCSPFPITLSSVQNGFLIKGLYLRKLPLTDNCCVLKVYYHPLDTMLDSGDVEVYILELLKEENNLNHLLFVTNVVLQERAMFLLNCKNVYFIHGVATDSTKFLFEQTLASSSDLLLEYRHVNEYLWVSLPNVSQILLKSPNAAIANEYAECVLDCLKMLLTSFKDSFCTVPAGGCFRLALVRKIFNLSNSLVLKAPPVKNREQLLVWNKVQTSDFEVLKHIDVLRLKNLDTEIAELVCSALMSITVPHNCDVKGSEPLNLLFSIISKSMNTLLWLCKVDGAIVKRKKGRVV